MNDATSEAAEAGTDRPTIEDVLAIGVRSAAADGRSVDRPEVAAEGATEALRTATEDGPVRSADGSLAVIRTDPELADEIAELLAAQRPVKCRSCGGTGWVRDENWQPEDPRAFARGLVERNEWDGLLACHRCNHDELFRYEITGPTTCVDGWTHEEERRVVEVLESLALLAAPAPADPEHQPEED